MSPPDSTAIPPDASPSPATPSPPPRRSAVKLVVSALASIFLIWRFGTSIWSALHPPPPITSKVAEEYPDLRDHCVAGDPQECEALATQYTRDLSASDRDQKALFYYSMACDGGDRYGCRFAGSMYTYGAIDVQRDVVRGMSLLNLACEEGEPTACNYLAQIFRGGDFGAPNEALAMQYAWRACDAGECDRRFLQADADVGAVLRSGTTSP